MFNLEPLYGLPLNPVGKIGAETIVSAAYLAMKIREEHIGQGRPFVEVKNDGSLVTAADPQTQAFVIDRLRECDQDMLFVGEEDMPQRGDLASVLFSGTDFQQDSTSKNIAYIDPTDHTTDFAVNGGRWTCMASLARYGQPWCSFVFAPNLFGGLLGVSEVGLGSWHWRHGDEKAAKADLSQPSRSPRPIICFNSRMVKDNIFPYLIERLPKNSSLNVAASGLGGLEAATGLSNLFMSSPLPPHDTLPGITAMLAAGGAFQIFRKTAAGNFTLPTGPNELDQDYLNPQTKTGVILGNQDLVAAATYLIASL